MNINDMIIKAYNNLMAASSVSDGVKAAATVAMQTAKIIRNDRMRTTAGRCGCTISHFTKTLSNLRIEWNSTLFSRMTEDEQFNTVSHEFAHAVEYCVRLKSDHDYFWQSIHRACGGTAARTHNYDTTGLRKNVRRLIVKDTITNREYKITVNNWNKINHNPKYQLLKTEVYQGNTMVACHSHA